MEAKTQEVPQFVEEGLEDSRRGAIFLFATFDVDDTCISAFIDGSLSLVGPGVNEVGNEDMNRAWEVSQGPAGALLNKAASLFGSSKKKKAPNAAGEQDASPEVRAQVKQWAENLCKQIWEQMTAIISSVDVALDTIFSVEITRISQVYAVD